MNWKLVLAILTCNILFMSSSYTMLIPFLPLYLTQELGVDPAQVNIWSGVVFSASFVVSAIMAPIWGRLADRHGKRLMAIRSSFLLSLSYLLCGLVQNPEQLVLVRLLQGFSSGLWPMCLAIMTSYAPSNRLGFSVGIMQGMLTAGGLIGPLLGGALATFFGMRISFFVGAAALFLNFVVFVFLIKEPPKQASSEEKGEKHSLLSMPLIRNLLFAGVIVQMVIMILQPILTVYIASLKGVGDNLVLISGLVFSLGGVAGAIASPFWGILGQKFGFQRTMIVALFLASIAISLQGMQTSLYGFAAMQFTGNLFFSGIYPSINSILARHSPADAKGRVYGFLFAAQQMGSILGPILGGVVATFFGMQYVFLLAGVLLLLLFVFLYKHFRNFHALREMV